MSARECRCEELEAVVEKCLQVAVAMEFKDQPATGETLVMIREIVLSSPTLSSLLARREAEAEVIEAARKDKAMRYGSDHWKRCTDGNPLCTALARLDQLEKEKA